MFGKVHLNVAPKALSSILNSLFQKFKATVWRFYVTIQQNLDIKDGHGAYSACGKSAHTASPWPSNAHVLTQNPYRVNKTLLPPEIHLAHGDACTFPSAATPTCMYYTAKTETFNHQWDTAHIRVLFISRQWYIYDADRIGVGQQPPIFYLYMLEPQSNGTAIIDVFYHKAQKHKWNEFSPPWEGSRYI